MLCTESAGCDDCVGWIGVDVVAVGVVAAVGWCTGW